MSIIKNKPFTDYERQLAITLISKQLHTVDPKKRDKKITLKEKNAKWEAAANEFNNSHNIQQTVSPVRLKKFWANMKMKAKDAKARENQWKRSCGGSPELLMGNIEHQVMSTIPTVMNSVEVVIGSDNVNIKGEPTDDDSSEGWPLKRKRRISQTFSDSLPIPSQPLLPSNYTNVPSTSNVSSTLSSDLDMLNPSTSITSSSLPSDHINNSLKYSSISQQYTHSHIDFSDTHKAKSPTNLNSPLIEDMKIALLKQQYYQNEAKFKLEMSHKKILNEMEIQFCKQKYMLILNNLKNNNTKEFE